MAPLAGDLVGPVVDLLVDHDSPSHTRAEDGAKDSIEALTGAVDGFGEGEAVGVVGDSDGTIEA